MEKRNPTTKQERIPSFWGALAVLLLCVSILLGCILVLKLDTAIALIIATVAIVLYGIRNGISYAEMQKHMMDTLADAANILVFIALIGALVASFMAAGTIPYIIYIGLKLISPAIFLPLTFIMCSIVSLCAGSGMSSTFTVGVACIGIAEGMDFSLPMTAAAVACGAYLGDKQSPVSGFAAFAAGVCHVDFMKHCKGMLYTTFPAFLASLIVFFVLGLMQCKGMVLDTTKMDMITGGLDEAFRFSLVALIPLGMILLLIMVHVPSVPVIAISAFVASIVAILYQGVSAGDALNALMNGYQVESDLDFVKEIADRGGMVSMASTLLVIMMALCMGGAMDRTHIIELVAGRLANAASNAKQLVTSTVFLTIFGHIATSHALSAAVISVHAFEKKYDELGVDKAVLSRSISDGSVVLSPIVPWCPDAIVCAQALGVATLAYAPYYFMIYFTVIAAIVCAVTGLGMKFGKDKEPRGEQ